MTESNPHTHPPAQTGSRFGNTQWSMVLRDDDAMGYAEIATRLGTTTAAVKMAAMRLRARYQAILREEIARTVASPDEIDDEIRHLFSVFSS